MGQIGSTLEYLLGIVMIAVVLSRADEVGRILAEGSKSVAVVSRALIK